MPKQVRRPYRLGHIEVVTHARKLIERSKRLIADSLASTFLCVKHYYPPPRGGNALRAKKRGLLKVIDGNQEQKGRVGCSVSMGWQPIRSAPFCRDLEFAVIDLRGVHTLVFPCRRILRGWVKAETNERVDVCPTHWRAWKGSNSALFSLGLGL